VAASAFEVRYDGHQVWRFSPQSESQLIRLKSLIEKFPTLDYWRVPRALGFPVDIRVSPDMMSDIAQATIEIPRETHIVDLQQHFEAARVPSGSTWDESYHDWDDILAWMTQLAAANPSFVTMVPIGLTYEANTYYALKITTAPANTVPQLYLDGGIHAREWMAPAVVEYMIGQFINNKTMYASYLAQFEWYLIPVWNVDGYNYTWTTDPNWRKNRQPNGVPCVGTDLCRNAAAGWGGQGSSPDPCSDTYHGASAWSAPETASYRDYISKLTKLKTYVNFHSYDESWLDPYGYTSAKPADYTEQETNAKNCTTAIKSVNGAVYAYGPAYTTIYPASGVPSDWVYDSLKVKLSQAVELRGNSFQPPPNLIIPIGEEMLVGVLQLAMDVAGNP